MNILGPYIPMDSWGYKYNLVIEDIFPRYLYLFHLGKLRFEMFIEKKHEYKAERFSYKFALIIGEGHIIITPLIMQGGSIYILVEDCINLRISGYILNLIHLLPSLFRYYQFHDLLRCSSPSSEASSVGSF